MSSTVSAESPGIESNVREPRVRKRRRRRWLVYAVLAYVGWCTTLYFYQDRLLFPANMAPPAPEAAPRGVEVVSVPIEPIGRVEGLFWPAAGATADAPRPVVVFCHGNAEIADYQDRTVRAYLGMGCSVFVLEYPGYGRSSGRPSEATIVATAVDLFDAMARRPDVDRSHIVFHGRSLGGGVAAQLAARRAPAGLILESTFTSVARFSLRYAVPSFLATSPFHTDRVIKSFQCPMLIFHGDHDTIVPVSHGRRLHELVPSAKYVEYPADHLDFPGGQNEQNYWHEIEGFLRAAGVIR